jgi:hypothetical protein
MGLPKGVHIAMPQSVIQQLEVEMQRQAIVSLLILALLFAFVMWVSYHVIRAAIRDGIKESGLVQRRPAWQDTVRKAGADHLPEMRAD